MSIATHNYPRIVWRDRTKKLWNPIHKKALKNLPEERVRLRIMESLIQRGWSRHRISTEEAIGQLGDKSMRTDIICYNQQFEPRLLVECKAEYVPISAKTAEQLARYNQKVGAPYLLMTNGVADYWYAIDEELTKVRELDEGPEILNSDPGMPEYNLEDWKERGFLGSKAVPDLRIWLEKILPTIWFPEKGHVIKFLNFSNSPSDVDLNHYYHIKGIAKQRRLALTTLQTAYGGSRMIVILNEKNENRAVLEINLDLLFASKKGNSSVYSREGIRTFDLANYLDLSVIDNVEEIFHEVDDLFAEYVE